MSVPNPDQEINKAIGVIESKFVSDALNHESTPQETRWCEIERAAQRVVEKFAECELSGAKVPVGAWFLLLTLKELLENPPKD
ncbi:MAG: hypothetical protein JKY67_00020 [Pseudomonadales bacterium]|nr:hypothetical protein [Pseudomonadales bacterium]